MQFHQIMGSVAAFLLSAWVFVIALFAGTFGLVPVSYTVVLGHALVLGLPIFLILWWKRWVNAISCVCGGFLIAAASGIVPQWPMGPEGNSASVRGVPLVVDGVPTVAGWIDFLQILIFLGAFGAIAGIAFWLILLASGALAPAANGGTDRWQRRRAIALGSAGILLTSTVLAIPGATWGRILRPVDQTCHNVLRDRDSIAPKVSMDLQIAPEQVPRLIGEMREFAASHELQFRDASVSDRWFISLCDDRGATIQLQHLADISVFELQPGSGWQLTTRELIERIETLWPGKLRFHAPLGGYKPRPEELK